ncbi:MAG: hypothetical protein NVS9B10_24070 [Nevskia sp.]
MSNIIPHRWALIAAGLLLLAACASPQRRIDNNQDAFNKLPPEQQALVRQGKVGIGFDETAVKLALGNPARITERTDASGKSTVWRYVEYETDGGVALYSGFYHYGYSPFFFPLVTDYGSRRERDTLRVVFTGGKVASIEQEVK